VKRLSIYGLLLGIAAAALIVSCSSDPRDLDNDELSSLLSLSNVVKTEVRRPGNVNEITGLIVDTTVIHTGFATINVPFRMTWALRKDGSTVGSAWQDFPARFSPGQSASIRLVIPFAARTDLDGLTDIVTFDLLDTNSLSPIGN
jgi:hypothetical protein